MFSDFQKTVLFSALCLSFIGYSFYLYAHLHTAETTDHKRADQGKKIWQENNCISCHQIYQLGGYLGPDLTNVYAKGPQYIKAFVQNGTAIMPKFELSEPEIEALTAYLQQINATGNADPRSFKISANGMTLQ